MGRYFLCFAEEKMIGKVDIDTIVLDFIPGQLRHIT